MNHKNIRYKSTQITQPTQQDNNIQQLNNTDLLNPHFNQYITSQSSQKSSQNNLNAFDHGYNNLYTIKSRSKHQSFRPSMQSQEDHFDDYKMYSDSISEYGAKHNSPKVKNELVYSIKSQQNFNQLQSRYQNIQNLLHQENHNLKQQNRLLLQQLRKSNKKQKKYKDLYAKTYQQLIITSQDRDYYRQQYRQLSDIVQNQMHNFQEKLNKVTMKTIGSQQLVQQGEMLTNDFNNFKRKISMSKFNSQSSDHTHIEALQKL